jgi:phosphoadenosine phosphosulfate reductase
MNSPVERPTDEQFTRWNLALTPMLPEERLQWAAEVFDNSLVMVTSFQSTGMVILDRLMRVAPQVQVLMIDTGFLFPETLEHIAEVQRVYPAMRLVINRTALTPEQQAQEHGPALWERDPDLCCRLRKVLPVAEVLGEYRAWVTGLRRDQAATRALTPFVQWDAVYGKIKFSPLADWTEEQVWNTIRAESLPYNPLHDQSFPSIGCTHCTRPVTAGGGLRDGRWAGRTKTECGLHVAADAPANQPART